VLTCERLSPNLLCFRFNTFTIYTHLINLIVRLTLFHLLNTEFLSTQQVMDKLFRVSVSSSLSVPISVYRISLSLEVSENPVGGSYQNPGIEAAVFWVKLVSLR
jgi:hypothetical protein